MSASIGDKGSDRSSIEAAEASTKLSELEIHHGIVLGARNRATWGCTGSPRAKLRYKSSCGHLGCDHLRRLVEPRSALS